VDDVVGAEADRDRLPDREMDLVRGFEIGIVVANPPPPPFADNIHPQFARLRVAQRGARVHGDHREQHEDHHWHDDPAEPDEHVVANRALTLFGSYVPAA
jgi:hypothetical protein